MVQIRFGGIQGLVHGLTDVPDRLPGVDIEQADGEIKAGAAKLGPLDQVIDRARQDQVNPGLAAAAEGRGRRQRLFRGQHLHHREDPLAEEDILEHPGHAAAQARIDILRQEKGCHPHRIMAIDIAALGIDIDHGVPTLQAVTGRLPATVKDGAAAKNEGQKGRGHDVPDLIFLHAPSSYDRSLHISLPESRASTAPPSASMALMA